VGTQGPVLTSQCIGLGAASGLLQTQCIGFVPLLAQVPDGWTHVPMARVSDADTARALPAERIVTILENARARVVRGEQRDGPRLLATSDGRSSRASAQAAGAPIGR